MTRPKNPDLKLFDGRYLAFAGTFLGRSNERITDDERAASQIIRNTFERTWKPGTDAVTHMHDISRRALQSIERDGLETFIQKHSGRQDAA